MGFGRKFVTFAAVVGLTVIGGGFASATDSDTATVTFTVASVRDIALDDSEIVFGTVPTDFGAASPDEEDGGTATYSTNETGDQIAVKLNAATETGVALTVEATVTSSVGNDGTAAAEVTLTASDQALVTTIGPVASAAADLVYTLSTNEADPSGGEESYTVTYTVKAGA